MTFSLVAGENRITLATQSMLIACMNCMSSCPEIKRLPGSIYRVTQVALHACSPGLHCVSVSYAVLLTMHRPPSKLSTSGPGPRQDPCRTRCLEVCMMM